MDTTEFELCLKPVLVFYSMSINLK